MGKGRPVTTNYQSYLDEFRELAKDFDTRVALARHIVEIHPNFRLRSVLTILTEYNIDVGMDANRGCSACVYSKICSRKNCKFNDEDLEDYKRLLTIEYSAEDCMG